MIVDGAAFAGVGESGKGEQLVDQPLHSGRAADNARHEVFVVVMQLLLQLGHLNSELFGGFFQELSRMAGIGVGAPLFAWFRFEEPLAEHEIAEESQQCAAADGARGASVLDDYYPPHGHSAKELIDGANRGVFFISDDVGPHHAGDRMFPVIERDHGGHEILFGEHAAEPAFRIDDRHGVDAGADEELGRLSDGLVLAEARDHGRHDVSGQDSFEQVGFGGYEFEFPGVVER